MSASASATDAMGLPHGQGAPSAEGRAASPVPSPWRPSSRPGRSSPAPSASALLKDSDPRPSSSSSPSSSTSTSTGGVWVSPSARGVTPPTTHAPTSSSEQGPSSREQSEARPFGSPVRTSSYTAPTNRGLSAGTTSSHGVSTSQATPTLKMEDLAARFNNNKFPSLQQLPPALTASSSSSSLLADKDKRAPSAFGTPGSTHMAHIKVQRTASLTNGSQPSPVAKGLGGKTQPSHLSQGTDMRRTASHNNAFSSGLGSPVIPSGGAHMDSTGSTATSPSTGQSGHNPFSLGVLSRASPRRSSLNPQDPGSTSQSDHAAAATATADKYPLQHPWTLYYDITGAYSRSGSSTHNFESGLKEVGTFTTVENFARHFNWIAKPHKIENSSNYHLFKDGIKPMWEDPANSKGGRWSLTLMNKNPDLLDRCWMELAYALVGEQLDAGDDICGAVLSRRTRGDRLTVWVRDRYNLETVNGIGKRLISLLDLAKENISLEFVITTDSNSSSVSKECITLDTIRQELASEFSTMNGRAAAAVQSEATPGLSTDSLSATPASATSSSPATPADLETDSGLTIKVDSAPNDEMEGLTESNASGLLISLDGGRSSLISDDKEGSY